MNTIPFPPMDHPPIPSFLSASTRMEDVSLSERRVAFESTMSFRFKKPFDEHLTIQMMPMNPPPIIVILLTPLTATATVTVRQMGLG